MRIQLPALLGLASALSAQTHNFGIATLNEPAPGSGYVVIDTTENDQGVDMNGDGEIGGAVIVIAEPDGTLIDVLTGSASLATTDGDWFGYTTNEQFFDTDLNGDHDLDDLIPFVHHVPSGTTHTLPYSVLTNFVSPQTSTLPLGSGLWALRVREAGQGGKDLNGDGDNEDVVLHVFHAEDGAVVNTGLPVAAPVVAHGWVVFRVPESSQGVDLNADGDMLDGVLHAYRGSDQRVVNLGVAGEVLALTHPLTAILVSEEQQGASDFNRDGDAVDQVLFVLDLQTARIKNAGVSIYPEDETVVVDGRAIGFRTRESSEGVDLNSDGDLQDRVVQVYDGRSGAVVNTGFSESLFAFNSIGRPALQYPHVVAASSELSNGEDFNGDGDTDDKVLFTHDLSTGVTTNTGHAALTRPFLHGGFAFFGLDNGAFHGEILRYDVLSGDLLSTEVLVGMAAEVKFDGASALFVGTGPGDVGASIWLHHLTDGSSTSLGGLFIDSTGWVITPDTVFFQETELEEWLGGPGDLNGNGKFYDYVTHSLSLPGSR